MPYFTWLFNFKTMCRLLNLFVPLKSFVFSYESVFGNLMSIHTLKKGCVYMSAKCI